ncbi:MAG TPA: cupin domain-containing protein [Candidatus Dormibacteraeota bacterium]|nr:cupin domain-containing protein [Candidatus Dormibacteraeota bacterium]
MSDYSIVKLSEVKNFFKEKGWPGEMRFMSKPLATEQVAVSYRKMPTGSGGKGGYGHRHKVQEEVVFVLAGELEFKLDDKIEKVKAPAAVRIAPHVFRSIWNSQPKEAELLIISKKIENLDDDVEYKENFWPE